jgi:putative transposase
MLIERDRHLKADRYERTSERTGYANEFKPQTIKNEYWQTTIIRTSSSERALKISLAEMYIQGVSTRKVNAILSELCGFKVTSSEVSRAIKELDEQLESWRNRELSQYVYLILGKRLISHI